MKNLVRGSPARRWWASVLRDASLLLEVASVASAIVGRESTALITGALSTALRIAADAVEGRGDDR